MAAEAGPQPINCTIKPAVGIKIGDQRADFSTGCSIIDVTFPNVYFVEVGEIHFKNFYTAWLSVRVQFKESRPDGIRTGKVDPKWQTCLKRKQLMPDAHCETGSEDYFTITKKQLRFELTNIVGLRFILRQPSPVWKEFKIEDIRLYKHSVEVPCNIPLPGWLTEANREDRPSREIKGIGSIDKLSASLQSLWAMTEQTKANQPTIPVGRYDIDGCYEINLLSYT